MRGIRIGSVFGIPIKLDLTFLIVLPLFAWLIGSDVTNLAAIVNDLFGSTIDGAAISAGSMQWVLGSAAAIGLFAGVLLHEFGHSLVAMRYGYEIESITLWLFGGVARFKEIPEDWKQEFTIAVAGPVVSVAIGVASYAGFLLLPESQAPAQFVLGYLALVNVSLAVFNMLPGFPMDGGRVLRALLARNRPHAKATQMAAEVGKVFAFLLGLFGLFFNLFLVALAFFIYMGASGEAQQTVLKATFQDVVVRDIMTGRENLDVVDEKTSVAELLERMFVERHTGYPVLRNGDLVGMVTLDDARGVKEVERDAFRVDDIMSDELATITPDADAMDAIALMQERGVGRLPVVDEAGELVGLVSRSDLVTAFNIIRSRGSLDAMPRSDAGLAQLR
ncbi:MULTISPECIES: M50 family metallopeptidase [Haloferax]|uniref:M50 family metallopeptidase n=1 Tax=Haloferax sp. Atlit-48N TaxID=2077198 RepID=A0ACD5I1D0_9EURY|nr:MULTISPECIES: M50 family metallopeptidase [Haloferax]ELK54770.1 SpoIVFB-type metallopeptidase [Haloferax sp. BAB-2207]MBC9985078.1 CBS domain-containing protein [Haloferax sp. AS1]RDZ33476.1 CBS domain-containing protein [Haloferax sp. Atlit-48N]RDZ41682.1 CBS domain-containing protein [Haloferax sp. Atlit-47N]WEL28417.1 Zn-dependent protease fused to CBS domain [Haloferax alexandrinus]